MTSGLRWRIVLVAAALCCQAARAAQWTLKTDFENGMRQGWESYPLAQDAGYDPTLDPVQYEGRRALERHKAPSRTGPFEIGFIHKVAARVGSAPMLRFACAVPYYATGAQLAVRVFTDRQPVVLHVPVRDAKWNSVSLPIAGLASDSPVKAVSISVELQHADEGRVQRFLIDDVQLTVERAADLQVTAPASIWDGDRRLHYVRRAVSVGDTIRAECPGGCGTVRITNPAGRSVGPNYKIAAADPVGVWRLELERDGATATMLVLVRGSDPGRLMFDELPPAAPELLSNVSDQITRLRKRVHVEFGPNIASYNDRLLLPGLPSYFALLQPPSELAVLDALHFAHKGDDASFADARRILLAMSGWPTWVHPWFTAHGYGTYYPVGIVASNLAITLDVLRPKLTASEIDAVERGFLEKSIEPAFREYVINNRIAFNTSNWIGHAVGGALLASLASRNPDVAGYTLGLLTKQREHLQAAYTEDGSYGEGTSYMKFDMQTSSLAAAAMKRHLGVNVDRWLTDSWKNLRYICFGDGEGLDFGDTHASLRPFGVYAYAASLNTSAPLSQLYFENIDSGAGGLVGRVLWEGLIRKPSSEVPAELPRSAVFGVRGSAVLRSGWQPGATVIHMRAGANFNHNHADQGSLFLAHDGQVLIGEAGYSDYYKDPFYDPYVIQAAGHNTLLVDGNPESQVLPSNRYLGGYPSITRSQLSGEVDVVEADLTAAYKSNLDHYTRTLLYRRNGPLVVVDRVVSSKPHVYSVLWHPDAAVERTGAERTEIRKGSAALDLQVFSAASIAESTEQAPLLLNQYEKSETGSVVRLPILRFSTAGSASTAMFVSVLWPRGAADKPNTAAWHQIGARYELIAGDAVVTVAADGSMPEMKLRAGEAAQRAARNHLDRAGE